MFPNLAAIFFYVFPQCIVGWSGVKNFAACWSRRLCLVNVALFEGCNMLFQLFDNVFHRQRITKMERWRSLKVPSSTSNKYLLLTTNLVEKVIFAQSYICQFCQAKKNMKRKFEMPSTTNWALMVFKYLTPIASKKIGLLEVNTYHVLFWKILINTQNWILQRKVQRKGET